jgi:hypothetical protein
LSCSLCETRKEKRFCPAIHGSICPQCCGQQREVTLECPSSCLYLQQARQHERPGNGKEISAESWFAHIEIGQRFLNEHEHLVVGLSFGLAQAARADRNLTDADLISALSGLAKSYETLANSGLHYGAPTPNLQQEAVTAELQKMVQEYRATEQKHMGFVRLREQDILHGLVFLVRMAYGRTSGRPKSRGFIDFLLREFRETTPAPTEIASGNLILP